MRTNLLPLLLSPLLLLTACGLSLTACGQRMTYQQRFAAKQRAYEASPEGRAQRASRGDVYRALRTGSYHTDIFGQAHWAPDPEITIHFAE